MKQLIFNDIMNIGSALLSKGMTIQELSQLPVYIGNDDELNGIHCAWCVGTVDANSNNEDSILVEMINNSPHNYKLTEGKAIIIT